MVCACLSVCLSLAFVSSSLTFTARVWAHETLLHIAQGFGPHGLTLSSCVLDGVSMTAHLDVLLAAHLDVLLAAIELPHLQLQLLTASLTPLCNTMALWLTFADSLCTS